MSDPETRAPTKRTQFVRVTDKAGNEYMCPAESLKDPNNATEEELENCVDDAKVAVRPGG